MTQPSACHGRASGYNRRPMANARMQIAAVLLSLAMPLGAMQALVTDGAKPVVAPGDPAVTAAVEKGLAWLAAQQNARGFWHGLVGRKGRGDYSPLRSLEEQKLSGSGHLGVTALCGMAFLAGGHLPGRGRYGQNVRNAIDAVLSCIEENGVITIAGSRMYSHAFATLFLAEVDGMFRDPRIREGLERATRIIVDCQNEHGGWRYAAFARDSDLSVTVCQLQALRAARNIGIGVPKSTVDAPSST